MRILGTRSVPAVCAITFSVAPLVGCATDHSDVSDDAARPAPVPSGSLEGTTWQLVEIRSMSDEIGTARAGDPSRYTVSFEPAGHVAFRLDCNRGTGTWSVEPTSRTTGSLSFGPVAATRALCPPPSLGERIAADLEYVRSYTIAEGRLHWSLLADGGIYVWEPAPEE